MTSQQRQRINAKAFAKIIRPYFPDSDVEDVMTAIEETASNEATRAPFLPSQLTTSAQCVWEENNGAKLYLSDANGVDLSSTSALLEANVRAIVNCTPRRNGHPEDIIMYCQVPVHDVDIANIKAYFSATCVFLRHQLQEKNHSVIVHCMAGVSRSATIVLAYLIHCHNMPLKDAFRIVRSRRPIVRPNNGFWAQLTAWELERSETKSIAGVLDDDADWPSRSLALFATLRNVPDTQYEDLCFGNLSATSETIFQALDFVWGRGVSDIALAWLHSFCNNVGGAKAMVAMVEDPGSEFSRLFEGEIYPRQVERLKETLASLKDS